MTNNNINKAKNHLSSLLTEHKKTTTYDIESPGPGFGQVQTCCGIKQVELMTTTSPLDNWISICNTIIKKHKPCTDSFPLKTTTYRHGMCFVCHIFSYHPFYFDFHSARVIFYVFSGFYFWNVNRTPTWHLSKMFKVAFKDVSTKNSEPTYWTILFVMLKIYFIYKVAGKKYRRAI
jgi:hypothetical protein